MPLIHNFCEVKTQHYGRYILKMIIINTQWGQSKVTIFDQIQLAALFVCFKPRE